MNRTSTLARCRRLLCAAFAAIAVHGPSPAADIDIYAATGRGDAPNVLFFFDNTANWTRQEQAWVPQDSWKNCSKTASDLRATGKESDRELADQVIVDCKDAIEKIFYVDKPIGAKRPWDNGFVPWTSAQAPTQGTVQVRAFKLVLNALVCAPRPGDTPVNLNLGLAMFSPDKYKGTVLSTGDPSAFIYHAVQPLTAGACSAILTKLNALDESLGNAAAYTAPQDSNYGAAFYEVFKYFGGYTNPVLAGGAVSTAGTPIGAAGYGNRRFSLLTPYDDPAAFSGASRLDYVSPIAGSGFCGKNYLVFVGNTYPKAEPRTGATNPLTFRSLGYTPPTLDLVSSDTDRLADEWSQFLARTDVSSADGIQPVYTYAVNVFNDKPDVNQTKLLKSIAAQGGVGVGSGYLEAGGDLYRLVKAFERILLQVSAVDSVFAATTLPVSTTTQGTFLNQVFVGMFRPDAQFGPRWVGNLKQYQLGFVNGVLDLVDANGNSAVLGNSGFFSPLAESFWTRNSVFFTNLPSGGTKTPGSDLPDGYVVEKGGAAQWLRQNNLQNADARNLYTLPSSPTTDVSLSNFAFKAGSVSGFDDATIAWVRGEANAPAGLGSEEFVGSYLEGTTVKTLGTRGARHSIHGDVLHSRPVAINYGKDSAGVDDVVVYYGSNEGMFRAIDGRKEGSTAGFELWSFIAPELYPMIKRQRDGTPLLHLPETDSSGKLLDVPDDAAPKDYGMDGPVGAYVLYYSGTTSVKEAIIYTTMRRGGRSVYAIDVTNKADPRFKWKITGGTTSGFGELAQTWSMAKPIVYKSTTSDPPPVVVVMGGGYDPSEDKNETGSPSGNRIYFINGRTGELIKSVETEYSVPSDVTVVDTGAGVPNRAYAVDVRGNVYRIDLPTSDVLVPATSSGSPWADTKAVKIAELGGKAFYAPDVVVTSKFVVVLVGTGDREKPLLTSKLSGSGSTEGFYLIKDNLGAPRSTVLKPSDLALVAEVNKDTMKPEPKASAGNEFGCYIKLAENGEKVVNAPTTVAGVTYFGTNRPTPKDTLSCRAGLGEAYAYRFPLFCAAPNSTKLETGGLPPSPVAGIVELETIGPDGQKVKKREPFIIGAGTSGSPFVPENPKPPVPPVRKRLHWYIDNANR